MTTSRTATASLQPHDGERGGGDVAALAALEEPNRRRLYELIAASHAEVGRDEAAERLGISRELAAFHLDRLVQAGLLEAGYRRLSGRSGPGAGRPAKVYRRAPGELSVSLPPRRYGAIAEVFAQALAGLGETVGWSTVAGAVNEPARRRGQAAGAEARSEAGRRPTHERLTQALRRLLTRGGFEPEVDAAGAVTLCNCPYRALSDAYRDVTCGANVAWAEGVVEGLGDERLSAEFVPTDGRCCVRFSEA